jgi:hypothetical protein
MVHLIHHVLKPASDSPTLDHFHRNRWTNSPEYAAATIGLGRLSKVARLSENNCRLNIRTVVKKLALEEIAAENSRAGIGKTYRVYSYGPVLARRRAAGMEWVIRTKGLADCARLSTLRKEPANPTSNSARSRAPRGKSGRRSTMRRRSSTKISFLPAGRFLWRGGCRPGRRAQPDRR